MSLLEQAKTVRLNRTRRLASDINIEEVELAVAFLRDVVTRAQVQHVLMGQSNIDQWAGSVIHRALRAGWIDINIGKVS